MKRGCFFGIFLVIFACLFLCSCGSVMSELRGTAAPVTDTSVAKVPVVKKYDVPQAKIVEAAKRCFDNDGMLFQCGQGNSADCVRITTEPVMIEKSSFIGGMFGGSSYYATQIVDVEKDGSVRYLARFSKSQMLGFANSDNLKYPEKENEMRARFFADLDKAL